MKQCPKCRAMPSPTSASRTDSGGAPEPAPHSQEVEQQRPGEGPEHTRAVLGEPVHGRLERFLHPEFLRAAVGDAASRGRVARGRRTDSAPRICLSIQYSVNRTGRAQAPEPGSSTPVDVAEPLSFSHPNPCRAGNTARLPSCGRDRACIACPFGSPPEIRTATDRWTPPRAVRPTANDPASARPTSPPPSPIHAGTPLTVPLPERPGGPCRRHPLAVTSTVPRSDSRRRCAAAGAPSGRAVASLADSVTAPGGGLEPGIGSRRSLD